MLGDSVRLRQVVDNLATNARVHTTPGSPVALSLRLEGDVLVLTVADSGPGMTQDEVAHAFERFYRVDTSRTRATGGTGLGLSIVQAIVDAHGGTLALRSSPEAGTVVEARLPLAGAHQDAPGSEPVVTA